VEDGKTRKHLILIVLSEQDEGGKIKILLIIK
jgi:hypothetical protein